MTDRNFYHVSTPGRVCLFGEHQDYLGLPVIPCAISLRISIEGRRCPDPLVRLDLPDIGSSFDIRLDRPISYQEERDYFRSSVVVLQKEGFRFSTGFEGTVHGEIPINSGTSSSSALVVSWVNLLARLADVPKIFSPEEIARLAHRAEVLEFNEPGGMMDHFSTAFGGVLYVAFHPEIAIQSLSPGLGTFVLGDSRQPKDTKGLLSRVKNGVLGIVRKLQLQNPDFSLHTADPDSLGRYGRNLNKDETTLLAGTLKNRDITVRALELLSKPSPDHRLVGRLLSDHQAELRDRLKISTPKIDRMINAAMAAGALGGKINGSGGGGCMFVYCPEKPEDVAEAIRRVGGKAWVVHCDIGTAMEIRE